MIRIAIQRALATTVSAGFALTAAAQDSTTASQGAALDEVVVTAQRRVENLQDVPIAATAIPGEQLHAKGVDRLGDLQFAAPSLIITDTGLTQSVNIRGIGLASGSPQVTNGVATYVDGLFQPPIVTTNSSLSYWFGHAVATIGVDRGYAETFLGGENQGVVLTTGGRASLTYYFSPLLNLTGNVGYRENEFTGIGGIATPVAGNRSPTRTDKVLNGSEALMTLAWMPFLRKSTCNCAG